MIIISQDKDNLINIDRVTSIWINNPLDNGRNEFEINADGELLGFYKTEERAKEILQEIVKKYSSYLQLNGGPALIQGQMDIQPNIFNIPKVYVMPER